MDTVVFVCTGNTCRSAMAEGIFNAMASERHLKVKAASCGLSAFPGDTATEAAKRAAKQYGADLSAHRSRRANEYLLEEAKFIYCMTKAHLQALLEQFPACAGKASCLGKQDIPDPWGGSQAVYDRTAKEIAEEISRLLDQWNGEGK